MSIPHGKFQPLFLAGVIIVCANLLSCSAQTDNQQYLLVLEQYVTSPEPVYRLFTTSLDGSQLRQVIEFSSSSLYWLSPNGKRLGIFSPWGDSTLNMPAQSLFIFDVLSGELIGQISDIGYLFPEIHRLYISNNSVVWSPQSDKLLYEKKAPNGSGSALWLYDVNTSSSFPITDGKTIDRNVAWSLDSQHIAFTSGHPCHEETPNDCPPGERFWNIAVLNIENKVQHIVTDFEDVELIPQREEVIRFCNLVWSPDSQFIAFENECDTNSIVNDHAVFVTSVDGTKFFQAANGKELSDVNSSFNYSYEWSLSSEKLYVGYSRTEYLEPMSGYGGFIVKDVNSLDSTRSVEILGMKAGTTSWSGDKQKIVIFTDRFKIDTTMPGPTLIGALSEDGTLTIEGASANLPYGSCYDQMVQWSSDSQILAYTMGISGGVCGNELEGRGVAVTTLHTAQTINAVESNDQGLYKPIGWLEIVR
ncbi:MAG: hypothetical protein KA314_14940 [Chloroflexi bacterium]|nr:hypothetical protein [Chloroflexota bacterium]